MESVHEEWRPVPQNHDYEVSNRGGVRSLARVITRPNRWGTTTSVRWPAKVLQPQNNEGYLQLKLGGVNRLYSVHQLVAWAFNGPQPEGTVVNHIDGNKLNNTPGNLEYISNSANVHHAYRTGLLSNKGTTNGRAKLTDELVKAILAIPKSVPATAIAKEFGCGETAIRDIRAGNKWKHVPRVSSDK